MGMLQAHMDAIEDQLIATSRVPANTGHTLHKGTPREAFIKQYLQDHLGSNVAIGTGEIIDASSLPNKSRSQFDIVIYKRNYPKLDFGGGISGFLIESVVATIEVKSLLDQSGIDQSIGAAHGVKQLTPNITNIMSGGWSPPKILNYVVAYDGPVNMATVHGWIINSHVSKSIPFPSWTQQTKEKTPGTSLDGVFILKKGFIKLDNTPLSLNPSPSGIYTISDTVEGTLLMLFLLLQSACDNLSGAWLNPIPYVANTRFGNTRTI